MMSFVLFAGIALALVPVFSPRLGLTTSGRILGLVILFVLPLLCAGLGAEQHIENTHSTQFCTSSCHIMELHGRSLEVDDDTLLVAAHYASGAIPRGQACYACHTTYTMYGGLNDKWRGVQHVWHNYLDKGLDETKLKIYVPFNNRECLHCHEGTRRFETGKTHRVEAGHMAKIRSNELSCVSAGCHDAVHDVTEIKSEALWAPPDDKNDQGMTIGAKP